MTDGYYSLKREGEFLYKEKGSKFIGYAFPCEDKNEFEESLKGIQAKHPNARHACYAYRFNPENEEYRVNDDGEPSGTAGLPIYNQMKSNELFQSGLVVIRYFGGTKLGAAGLVQAYKLAAQGSISEAQVEWKRNLISLILDFAYDQTGPVMRKINELPVEILEQSHEKTTRIKLGFLPSDRERVIENFKLIHPIKIEE